ncbi:MAG: hypothetical protein M4579_002871, partial [Chaenotheca gracillima]
ITIGTQPFTPSASGSVLVIGSQTVTAGSSSATVDGTPVSLGPGGILVYGSSTVTLPTATNNPGTTKPATTNPTTAKPATAVVWASTTVTSAGQTAVYVENQFSDLAAIKAPTLVTTPITITGATGLTSVVSVTESVNTGGFWFSPIPIIGPGGAPSLPSLPPPPALPEPPSCWKLGAISVGNCGNTPGGGGDGGGGGGDGGDDDDDDQNTKNTQTKATQTKETQTTGCTTVTATDYSVVWIASASSYSTSAYATVTSCGATAVTTTASAGCTGDCSQSVLTLKTGYTEPPPTQDAAAIDSATKYIIAFLSTASWGGAKGTTGTTTGTKPTTQTKPTTGTNPTTGTATRTAKGTTTGTAAPTPTAGPGICNVFQDPHGNNGGPITCSDICGWTTMPSETWGGSTCLTPTHAGKYLYTDTLYAVTGTDSAKTVIGCSSTTVNHQAWGAETKCVDTTPITTIQPTVLKPTGTPAAPSCNSPADPRKAGNDELTNGYVPDPSFFKAAINVFCGDDCPGGDCLSVTGFTLDGDNPGYTATFPCSSAQKEDPDLNCEPTGWDGGEPPYWEASGINFNIGVKLIDPKCTWLIGKDTCRSYLYNTLTDCPAAGMDWNECVAWTVGAGAAKIDWDDWQKVKVPT